MQVNLQIGSYSGAQGYEGRFFIYSYRGRFSCDPFTRKQNRCHTNFITEAIKKFKQEKQLTIIRIGD